MRERFGVIEMCAHAASEKKAENLVLLDLRGISSWTDFFLIGSALSEPQLKAIASSIREQLRDRLQLQPLSVSGSPASQWIAIDYGGVVTHLFLKEKREFYAIENLWRDAPRLRGPWLDC
jgi:ribosome-associated protein